MFAAFIFDLSTELSTESVENNEEENAFINLPERQAFQRVKLSRLTLVTGVLPEAEIASANAPGIHCTPLSAALAFPEFFFLYPGSGAIVGACQFSSSSRQWSNSLAIFLFSGV
ncbi:MAG: hypothetical protein KDI28_03430 [Pseudomonadales bacterium]|nr:hypothetical protein [Pseudomonadales bacterium]MCP5356607.1 hypothetical protein [Pseudomonadales bacterium]